MNSPPNHTEVLGGMDHIRELQPDLRSLSTGIDTRSSIEEPNRSGHVLAFGGKP
jgi:hypothetical protein